jgi:hypothetical protein
VARKTATAIFRVCPKGCLERFSACVPGRFTLAYSWRELMTLYRLRQPAAGRPGRVCTTIGMANLLILLVGEGSDFGAELQSGFLILAQCGERTMLNLIPTLPL